MVLCYKEMFDICKDLYLDQYTLYFNSIAQSFRTINFSLLLFILQMDIFNISDNQQHLYRDVLLPFFAANSTLRMGGALLQLYCVFSFYLIPNFPSGSLKQFSHLLHSKIVYSNLISSSNL